MNSMLKQATAGFVGLALTIPLTLAVGTSAHAQGSGNYSCTAPIVGAQNTPVVYDSNLPARLYLGDADVPLTIESQGTVSASTMDQAYNMFGARYVQGTTTMPFLFDGKTYSITHKGTNTPIVKGTDTVLKSTIENAITVSVPKATGVYPIKLAKAYTSQNKLWKDKGATDPAYDPGTSNCTRSEDLQFDSTEVWARANTVLAGPAGDVVAGAPIPVTAKVTAPGGSTTGSVKFTIAGQTVSANVNGSGVASTTLPAQPAGSGSVTAVFVPTGAMVEAAPIAPLTFDVVAATTTTSVVLVPAKVPEGTASTAKVQVAAATGKPSGTVQVSVDGQTIPVTVTDGFADVPLPVLPLGLHEVTATFVPADSGFFTGSSSEPVQLQVHEPAKATTTTLTLSKVAGTAGDSIAATVKVAAAGAIPVGTARVTIGGRQVSGLVDEQGTLVVDLPPLPAGTHEVKASFIPASAETFAASEASSVTLTLEAPANVASTAIDLSLPTASVRAGTGAKVKVFVSAAQGLPNGEVEVFVAGEKVEGTITHGKGEVTLPLLPPGEHAVTAAYTPSGAFAASETTDATTLTVTRAPSVAGLTLSSTSVTSGTSVTATVTVEADVPAEHLTGEVKVQVNGRTQSAPVTNGSATLDLGALPVGSHAVAGSFERSADSWASNSTAMVQQVVVAKAPVTTPAVATTTTLALARASVTDGERTQVTATVAGLDDPAGEVAFVVNGITLRVPVSDGLAQLSLPALPVGQHQVTASFVPEDATVALPSTAQAVALTVTAKAGAPVAPTSTTVTVPARVAVKSTFAATARVTGATTGRVVFTAGGVSVTANVSGGVATARLTTADVGPLGVAARFVPADATKQAPSLGTATVTVTKRVTRTTATAKAKKATKQLVLRSKTAPVDDFCGGTVTYQVRRGAKTVAKATAPVQCSGVATATVKLPKKKGKYTVTATFSGSGQVLGSTATARFKR